jgi:hypothetical protein
MLSALAHEHHAETGTEAAGLFKEGSEESESHSSVALAGHSRALHAFPSSLSVQALLAHRLGHHAAVASAAGGGGGGAVGKGVERAREGWAVVEGAGCVG